MSADDGRGATGAAGERGKTGDTGQPGETGQQGGEGRAGMIGIPGIIGERGRTGDHGQDGQSGAAGAPGAPGAPGTPGMVGAQGVVSPWLRNVLIWGYLLLIAALIVSVTVSQNAIRGVKSNAHQRDVDRYQSCLSGIEFIRQLNRGNERLAEIEAKTEYNTPVNAAASIERTKAYKSFLVTLKPNPCGEKP